MTKIRLKKKVDTVSKFPKPSIRVGLLMDRAEGLRSSIKGSKTKIAREGEVLREKQTTLIGVEDDIGRLIHEFGLGKAEKYKVTQISVD